MITITITIDNDGGVTAEGVSGDDEINSSLLVVGALEIVKDALVRKRWGIITPVPTENEMRR